MKNTISLLVGCLLAASSFAQSLYDEGTIQDISIIFAQSNWDALLDAQKAGAEDYTMAQSVTINGVVFDSVGVKYKGNSTYNANQTKNPFHIELDTYKEQDYQGYKDIKLSNVANDPSFVREVLSYKILRNYMDAPLSNYANVTVNGTLLGLYSNSEAISKTFVNDRFGSKKNTFVKCNPPAGAGPGSSDYPNLVYLGTDSTSYYAKYEIKSDGGWDELIDLCDTLGNHIAEIETVLDVDRALWMLAFDNVFVNLDSYIGGFAQNYYLYRDDNGRFLPIVWDLNESFGVFSQTGSGTNLTTTASKSQLTHLLNSTSTSYPLISKLLAVPTYKKMYLAHMKTMLQDNFTVNGPYYSQGQVLQTTINSAVQADQYKFYTYANFISNLTADITSGGGPRGQTIPGITNLMNNRYAYLMSQSDFSATEPSISNVAISDSLPTVSDTVSITATLLNETSVFLRYRNEEGVPFEKLSMFDDGTHNDGAANDGVYGVDVQVTGGTMEYYIYAENTNIGKFSPTNAEHEFYSVNTIYKSSGDIVINEILASNSNSTADQDGEYDDWIELYNKGVSTIDISGYNLTDDLSDLTLFTFPSGTMLNANEYVVVWADKDTAQVGYHADFKVSSSGETIVLTDASNQILDSISFGTQVSDTTYGRLPNGTGNFQALPPTFKAQNTLAVPVKYDMVINEFLASNVAAVSDQNGEFDDWIEIYNNGITTIALDDFRLTNDDTDYSLFSFPVGTTLEPDSYIVVWADADLAQSGYHADFSLADNSGEIYFADSSLNLIDSVVYGAQAVDTSYGRYINGIGNFQQMSPTLGAENTLFSSTTGDLVINEFLASNTTTIADQDGEFDDWVELYNKGSIAIDLTGYALSDDITDLSQFTFPANTLLQPDSFIVVWADKDSAQAGYHADFKLSASGETIYLIDANLVVLDSILYGTQTTDESFGRYPNGTGSFFSMVPTFRAQNVLQTAINEVELNETVFRMYPNPVTNSFTIELEEFMTEPVVVQVFSLTGQLIHSTSISQSLNVEVDDWSKGMYFIRVGNSTSRLVVQ